MSFEISSLDVSLTPDKADAGSEVRLACKVVAEPAQDLRGWSLLIRDHTGETAARLPFTGFDGTVNGTSSVAVKAPDAPGTYEWSAVPLEEGQEPDDDAALPATPFTLTVVAHSTRLVVWDVPSAIEAGRNFTIRIGLKGSSGCDMTGRCYEILDHAGEVIARGAVSGEIWPGSDGLQYGEAELVAPDTPDLFGWKVRVAADEMEFPHRAVEAEFRVRTVEPADCTVRIETVDGEKNEPLANMSIVMHPYRARSDAQGIAEIRVARGKYTVYVSGRGYYPVRRQLDVTQDVTTRAPLEAEPPQSPDW